MAEADTQNWSNESDDVACPHLLDAIDAPLLVLRGTLILHANGQARAILGAYIEGDDIRMAVRHPEAAALIASGENGVASLGGLGDSERQWLLHVRHIDARDRLLRLEDRSGQLASERMRTDFVANASHELRTPLAAISGFIETLEEANGPADGPLRTRFLGIMAQEARRMQRLIDDLMSLSRVEVDRYVRPNQTLDFAAAVATACAEIEAGGKADGRLAITLAETPSILGDAAQISQVIHNVVGNGLKYGDPARPIEVVLDSAEGMARLTVTDHGEGIAPEHLPRLTERFYRIDAGRSRSVGGTGLGLAIVKHIVERHRGRLEISSGLGIGTRVVVLIPLAASEL